MGLELILESLLVVVVVVEVVDTTAEKTEIDMS